MRILTIILFLNINIHAQIKGQFFDNIGTLPGVKIELTKTNISTESDFDGNFSIEMPQNLLKTNILFKYEMITVEIENIILRNITEIDFGKFSMPYFKEISLQEYENLNRNKQKNCEPIYSWNHHENQLIAYYFFNELSENYIVWHNGDIEKKIFDFKYDKRNKKVTVDWKTISEYN